MEFEGLHVKTERKKEDIQREEEVAEDSFVSGAEVGQEILDKIRNEKGVQEEHVVYGVYNNENKSIFTRINDFLIDRTSVGIRDKSYFFHMLAVMVDAGIPVIHAVKSLAGRSRNPRFRRVLNTVAHNCEQGAKFSEAMSRFSDIFDESEIGIIKSGEATGRLHTMLFKLSAQLDKRHDLFLKLWGAAVYPIAVFMVLVAVAVGMLVWIFPTLLSLLKEGGISESDLPFATKLLIFLQNGLLNYWWAILIVVFGLYALFLVYARSDRGAVRWDLKKLQIPIIGGLLRKVFVWKFVGMLGILIDAGLPVIQALKITGNGLTNRIYKLKLQEVIGKVRVGNKVSESLRDAEYLFPAEVTEMISVGENSASLAKVSEKIADQYQREIDNSLKKLTSVFEPIMILVVGVFVALLALAIMAPIFNLSSSIS